MTYLTDAQLAAAAIPARIDARLLGIYLGDHLTGATAGSTRIRDMAERYAGAPFGGDLTEVADQVELECETLRRVIEALELSTHPARRALAWAAERVGSLKPNGRLVGRSPMTPVLELEIMSAAVLAKGAGWEVLERHADDLGLPAGVFADLVAQSREQHERLRAAHGVAAGRAFRER